MLTFKCCITLKFKKIICTHYKGDSVDKAQSIVFQSYQSKNLR